MWLTPRNFRAAQRRAGLQGITDYLPATGTEWKKAGVVAGIVTAFFLYWGAKGVARRTAKRVRKSVERGKRRLRKAFGR